MHLVMMISLTAVMPPGFYGAASEGRWAEALDLALESVESDSSSADAWAAAAIAAFRSGTDSDAVGWVSAALAADSSSALAWTAKGVLEAGADPASAEESFLRALDLDPGAVMAMEGLAGILSGRGDRTAAVEMADRILDIDAMYTPVFLRLVLDLEEASGTEAALGRAKALSLRAPGDSELAMELARLFENAGLPDSAAAVYESVASSDSADLQARKALGLLCEGTGDFGEAIKHYREMIALDPGYFWAYGELAWCLEAVGLVDLARDWYLGGLEVNPAYAWAAYRLGMLYQDEGDADSAMTWFDRAIELDPLMVDAWVGRGLLEEDSGDYLAAAWNYENALAVDPLDVWTWGELAYVYEGLGMHGEAADAYETSVGIDPDYMWGWEQRGLLYEDRGMTAEAIAWYRLAAETSSRPSAWLLGELGMLLLESGMADSAAAVFESSIAVDSAYSFGTLSLARIEEDRGRLAEAAALLSRYAEISGDRSLPLLEIALISREMGDTVAFDSLRALAYLDDPGVGEDLAWSYHYSGMEERALQAILFAAGETPDDVITLRSLGELASLMGRESLADSIWMLASTVAPDDPSVWIGWGVSLSDAGDYAGAEERFRTAFGLDSTSYEACSYLGEALLFQDRYDESYEWLERSLEIDPSAVFSICYLGLIRERLGDPSGALERYLEALRLSPGYAYAEARIRNISDPSFDVDYWRTESRPVSSSIWADISLEEGNTEERRWSGGVEASWLYGPRGSRVTADFSGTLEEKDDRQVENTALASVGMDYFVTRSLYAKASSTWDRQPETVRPWQVSSYTSVGYREWITDWLYVAPELGAGLVTSQWYLREKRTREWTAYLSCGVWMNRENSLLPSLWIGTSFYLPPDDPEDFYAYGNAELSVDAWDRLTVSLGYSLDYTNRPVVSSWEKSDSEIYSRIRLAIF